MAPSRRSSLQRKVRRAVLQVLYEVDTAGHGAEESLGRALEPLELSQESTLFAQELALNVVARSESLDREMQEHAPLWPLSQLPVVDRNILRLAIFELQAGTTPVGVVINEAVELAKRFGGESSPRFVNGVLGSVWAARQGSGPNGSHAKEVDRDSGL